jgi:hypothetical protein
MVRMFLDSGAAWPPELPTPAQVVTHTWLLDALDRSIS